ncbi:YolD-like family protein [Paenibacillus sedimenti]|uniref:YolD-like family protein n=1 Tax=Paenibacillus sedimenti TaxID=2770274 RepID=A0A926KRC2_9BACL|nr:YolD-like family protein [Paenibacillus sedimenti]MBD0381888.1 YolD-like family protein [Paenibacillus sedimenti]
MNHENKKIAKVMSEALIGQQFVLIKLFDETGDQEISGLITKIDQELRRVKLSHEQGFDWIPIDDILSLDLILE